MNKESKEKLMQEYWDKINFYKEITEKIEEFIKKYPDLKEDYEIYVKDELKDYMFDEKLIFNWWGKGDECDHDYIIDLGYFKIVYDEWDNDDIRYVTYKDGTHKKYLCLDCGKAFEVPCKENIDEIVDFEKNHNVVLKNHLMVWGEHSEREIILEIRNKYLRAIVNGMTEEEAIKKVRKLSRR